MILRYILKSCCACTLFHGITLALTGMGDVFKPYQGRFLPGSIVATYFLSSNIECGHKCSIDHRCRSFNYENHRGTAKRTCELNSRSSVGHAQSSAKLLNDSRMTYYEKVVLSKTQPKKPDKPLREDDFDLKFPRKSTWDYVIFKDVLPWKQQFTLCARVQTTEDGVVFSYATRAEDKEIYLGYESGIVNVRLRGSRKYSGTRGVESYRDGQWHFVCITWAPITCYLTLYYDGSKKRLTGDLLPCQKTIREQGSIVFGQDQDRLEGGFEQHQSFQGNITTVNIWGKVLTEQEIRRLMSCSTGCPQGDVLSWSDVKSRGHVFGKVSVISPSTWSP